jgi:hypothetical protein
MNRIIQYFARLLGITEINSKLVQVDNHNIRFKMLEENLEQAQKELHRLLTQAIIPMQERENTLSDCISNAENILKSHTEQIEYFWKRLYYKRWFAIEQMAEYLVNAKIPGDYCEFGVYKGDTFGHCVRVCSDLMPEMRFLAFDSFQGLPEPRGIDVINEFTGNFHKGEFGCDEEIFFETLRDKFNLKFDRIITIPGWFQKTLTKETADRLHLEKVAAAWIDCDLYESCVTVLDFLNDKLSIGSVVVFDDWNAFRNLPDRGEQRACSEWLQSNPHLSLLHLFSFPPGGRAFTVGSLRKV